MANTLSTTNDFPIRHVGDVHDGKIRSVYWLNQEDSNRLISDDLHTPIPEDTPLGLMIISDRISSFDCIWGDVHGKGASLNLLSEHWFANMHRQKIADYHIVDVPHPLVWLVQKAKPVKVEAIARQYITGSMWRAYEKGVRNFCGQELPEGLQKNDKLDELLLTPTTKGVLEGIPGVPEEEDTELTYDQIKENYEAFGFKSVDDIELMNEMLSKGFQHISRQMDKKGYIFVDTKFEYGYGYSDLENSEAMIMIDEVATLDSSRIWEMRPYQEEGSIVQRSKELFRQHLIDTLDNDILLNKDRFEERKKLAQEYEVPKEVLDNISEVYNDFNLNITPFSNDITNADPRKEIMEILKEMKVLV